MRNNKKYKDTIFRYLFKQNKNFVKLYKYVTGKELGSEDVTFFDTSSLLINKGMQNDVSFITKDNRFIILLEHQSTITPNIALRVLLYYFELLKIYIYVNKINLFSYDVVKIPTAELYVLYNGKAKLKYTKQNITDNFYSDNGLISATVNIIDINFDRLEKDKIDKDVFVGYSFFIDQINFFLDKGFPLEEALEKAKEECRRNGYLLDYINDKGFIAMVLMDYTIEQEMNDRAEAAAKAAEKRGKIEGKLEGIKEGKKQMAKEMLKSNIPIGMIANFSKLTIEEIKQMQKENNN